MAGAPISVNDLIIALAESPEVSYIHKLFSDYLEPFQRRSPDININMLFLQYHDFIHQAVFLLRNRISTQPETPNPNDVSYLLSLFELFMNCLKLLLPVVPQKNKFYEAWHLLICSYQHCGKYVEAMAEISSCFAHFIGIQSGSLVPEFREDVSGFGNLISDLVFCRLTCVEMMEYRDYTSILTIVEEIQPWLRVIDEGRQTWLVSYLIKSALHFLVKDPDRSDAKFTLDLCAVSLLEHKRSCQNYMTSQLEDFIQKLSFPNCEYLCKVLDTVADKCKVKHRNIGDSNARDIVSTLRSSFAQLQQLKEMNCFHPTITKRLETSISHTLVEDRFRKQDKSFHESRDFIEKGKKSREQGIIGLDNCILYLNDAIASLGDVMSKKEEDRGPTCHVLAQAHSLRALCREDRDPESKNYTYTEDIHSAVTYWLNNDHIRFMEDTYMSQNNFKPLEYVNDLLLLKADIDDHRDICELMIKVYKGSHNLEECGAMLCETRSFTHVLCNSSLNAFVGIISKYRKMSVEDWRKCMPESFTGLHSYGVYVNEPVDTLKLKQVASGMMGKVHHSAKSAFLAAQLLYDLGERLVAEGSISEAFEYAMEARKLRTTLYIDKFEIVYAKQDADFRANREIESFHVHPLVATKVWSTDHVDDFNLTPYTALRCYLESIFQEGNILEILGDVERAEYFLQLGKTLSSQRALTIFNACFSVSIGKTYRKRQDWNKAATELNHAKSQCSKISCNKCRILLEAIVYQEQGHLYRSKYIKEPKPPNLPNHDNSTAKYRFKHAEDSLRKELNVVCKVEETKGGSARIRKRPHESTVDCISTIGHEVADVSDCCWHGHIIGDLNSLESVIQMQYVRTCKRYLLRVLVGKGKCFVAEGNMESAQNVLLESICLLVSMSKSCSSRSSVTFSYFFEFITKNEIDDVIGSDIASLLYIISWVSLRTHDPGKRYQSDKLYIPIKTLISGLELAFVLSSEVEGLFRKIGQLLAVLHVYLDSTASTSSSNFASMSSSNSTSPCQWAYFYHQATLGTNLFFMFYYRLVQVHGASNATSIMHRLKPKQGMALENFVLKFLKDLPPATILGIDILEDKYMPLLRNLLRPSSTIKITSTTRWLMASRFNSKREPLVVLLPIEPILVGDSEDKCPDIFKSTSRPEEDPPWGKSIIADKVAPGFQKIVKSLNYCSSQYFEHTVHNNLLVVGWMKELNDRAESLMRHMEEWFGQWRHILFGEPEDQNHNEYLSGCHIGTNKKDLSVSQKASQKNEPMILVPGSGIQMLPWDNMHIWRHKEVYRMPSFASIFYSIHVCGPHKEKVLKNSDVFYLVNPSADEDHTNSDCNLDEYFKKLGFKGKLHESPSSNELFKALVDHDLFIYVGHGNTLQYISANAFASLVRCPTSILMGCASGLLKLNGSYPPFGAPLSYILGGSPLVIANLWSVQSEETFNFIKTLFDAWVQEMSRDSEGGISSFASKDVPRIGSLIPRAREVNRLKYIADGVHVFFGIPTEIRNKSA